jgi:hypothetical protein
VAFGARTIADRVMPKCARRRTLSHRIWVVARAPLEISHPSLIMYLRGVDVISECNIFPVLRNLDIFETGRQLEVLAQGQGLWRSGTVMNGSLLLRRVAWKIIDDGEQPWEYSPRHEARTSQLGMGQG